MKKEYVIRFDYSIELFNNIKNRESDYLKKYLDEIRINLISNNLTQISEDFKDIDDLVIINKFDNFNKEKIISKMNDNILFYRDNELHQYLDNVTYHNNNTYELKTTVIYKNETDLKT